MLSLDSKLQSMQNNHQIHKPASLSVTIMMSSLCPSTSLKSPKTLYPAPLGVTLTHPAFHCFCPCPKAAKTPNSRSTLPLPASHKTMLRRPGWAYLKMPRQMRLHSLQLLYTSLIKSPLVDHILQGCISIIKDRDLHFHTALEIVSVPMFTLEIPASPQIVSFSKTRYRDIILKEGGHHPCEIADS